MIPKIIAINNDDIVEEIVSQVGAQNNIDPSHRMLIRAEKGELTVEQIHEMQKDIRVSFTRQVLVTLEGVDDSSSEVQNSLLKCLEEDSGRILFLLLVRNPSRLISTIRSRCGFVEEVYSFPENNPKSHFQDLFSFRINTDISKEEAVKNIDIYIQQSSVRSTATLRHLLQIRKLIIDNNMNPALATDDILLFLAKTSTMMVRHEKK